MRIVTGGEFERDPYSMAKDIGGEFGAGKIVVRSSSSNEDGMNTSNAGHYESVLGVDPGNPEEVMRAIREVLESYKCDLDDVTDEQVLIQTQVESISYSGVIFSRGAEEEQTVLCDNIR